MNSWRDRLSMMLLMAAVVGAHSVATMGLVNTPAAMLVFHGSAGLLDWMLAMVVPFFLSGRRCTLVQWLMIGSILGNFAGWLLYMHHVSPVYFNVMMWTLSAVQCVCILGPDLRDVVTRDSLVSIAHRVSGGNNS